MKAMKRKVKGGAMKAAAKDAGSVEAKPAVVKPKAPSLRQQIMARLKECSAEEVMREAHERMVKTSEAVAECESSFKNAEDEFKSLQEVVHAAKMEQNQALQRAKTTRAKQIELQKNMA